MLKISQVCCQEFVGFPCLVFPVSQSNVCFFPQTVNVIFEKIPENESGDACQTIQVNVLDCDTIGQAKEKSLQAFLNKNGFLYGLQLDEIGLGKSVSLCYVFMEVTGLSVCGVFFLGIPTFGFDFIFFF